MMKEKLLKTSQKTDMYRLQPGISIKPKLHHNCLGCKTLMTLSKDVKIKSNDIDIKLKSVYHYKCPGCNMEWFYDSYFRLINV